MSSVSSTSSVRCSCRRCSDSCSASTEQAEPVKPGDTIVAAIGALGSVDRGTRARAPGAVPYVVRPGTRV